MGERIEIRWIFLLLAVAVTAFIWQQSTVPAPASTEISDTVRDVVVEAVGGEQTTVGSFVDRFVRKIAHFVEFSLLGLCIEAYFLRRFGAREIALRGAIGLFVAAADETIQIFTDRGASVLDVLLDFSGFAFASLCLMLAGALYTYVRIKRKVGARDTHPEQDHV